jgi:hypothetical protein
MDQYAWWPITFGTKRSYYLCGQVNGTVFHGEQCGSFVGICLWFVSSGRQLSAPLALLSYNYSAVCSVVVRYTLEQRVFLYDPYVKHGSAGKCRRKFRRKFRDERVSSRQTIHTLVNKLRSTGLLVDKKQKHKRRVRTEEKLDDIEARTEHTPRKSLKRLALETRVS